MALPTGASIIAIADEGEAKTDFGSIVDFVAGLMGGKPVVELTIASGAVTASSTRSGDDNVTATPVVTIDTESDAATDTLNTIDVSAFEDGQHIMVGLENAARVVTIAHEAGGAGQMSFADGANLVLQKTTQWVLFYVDKSGVAILRERARFGFDIPAYGSITVESNATATTISASSDDWSNKVQIEVFGANGAAYDVTPDHTNDHLTIATDGVYLITASVSISGSANDQFSLAIFKNNGATQIGTRMTRKMGTTGDVGSSSISAVAALSAGDTVELWCQNETDTDDLTVQDAVLAVVRL